MPVGSFFEVGILIRCSRSAVHKAFRFLGSLSKLMVPFLRSGNGDYSLQFTDGYSQELLNGLETAILKIHPGSDPTMHLLAQHIKHQTLLALSLPLKLRSSYKFAYKTLNEESHMS